MANLVECLSRTAQAARTLLAQARMNEENVHDFRLCCKRLRAWLHLFADAHTIADRQIVRDMARAFGANRDDAVMRDTLARLGVTPQRIAVLLPPAKAVRLPARQRRQTLSQQLQTLVLRWQQTIQKPSPAELQSAITKSYKRSRDLGRKALRSGDAAELHRWRRRVKDLGYQLELLPSPGKQRARLQQAVVKLGKRLGEYHDLTVLEEALPRSEDTESLLRQIHRRREALLEKSRKGFDTVFTRSGKQFRRVLV